MSEPAHNSQEGWGRPFAYYVRVVVRYWYYLLLGLLVGSLAGVAYLAVRPQVITASSVVELSIITSDPFGLDRAPSSLLDIGTEQQVARSYLVAERAASDLDEVLTPSQVRSASEVMVGSQGTVVTINFTAADEELAREGADAVANSFLEVRGEQVERRISDQLATIEERLGELAAEQSDLLAVSDPDVESSLAESQGQLIRNEIQALSQQRTNLNAVDTSGGRLLTSASAAEVWASPSRLMVQAAGGLTGLLGGLVLAFVRQRFSHRVADVAELESVTGAPALGPGPEQSRWQLAGAVFVGMGPGEGEVVALVNLASEGDFREVTDAVRLACEQLPSSAPRIITVNEWFDEAGAEVARLRGVDRAALVVDPTTVSTARLEQVLEILRLLQVDVAVSFWCGVTRGRFGRRDRLPRPAAITEGHSRG